MVLCRGTISLFVLEMTAGGKRWVFTAKAVVKIILAGLGLNEIEAPCPNEVQHDAAEVVKVLLGPSRIVESR